MIKNYKFLNRHELHKIINRDISEFIFDYNEDLKRSESKSANTIEKLTDVNLKRFPRVSFPKNTNTPDFATLKDKMALEVKSTKSVKNGFNNAFKQANRQFKIIDNKLNKVVFINVGEMPEDILDEDIIEVGIKIAKKRKIYFFIIQRNDEIIYVHLP